ncbi:MAG: hypothetical protein V7739_00740 [Motiliproteus sp.]
MKNPDQQQNLKKKNLRLAVVLGSFAVLVLLTSVPFWKAVLIEIAKQNG